jgi:hypothetical protein
MSRERLEDVNLVIRETVVKGYHECLFTVNLGEEFTAEKKRAERGNAFKVVNGRGHLQRELVTILWPLTERISV